MKEKTMARAYLQLKTAEEALLIYRISGGSNEALINSFRPVTIKNEKRL